MPTPQEITTRVLWLIGQLPPEEASQIKGTAEAIINMLATHSNVDRALLALSLASATVTEAALATKAANDDAPRIITFQ